MFIHWTLRKCIPKCLHSDNSMHLLFLRTQLIVSSQHKDRVLILKGHSHLLSRLASSEMTMRLLHFIDQNISTITVVLERKDIEEKQKAAALTELLQQIESTFIHLSPKNFQDDYSLQPIQKLHPHLESLFASFPLDTELIEVSSCLLSTLSSYCCNSRICATCYLPF